MAAKKNRRWSRRVTQTSDALDLKKGLFSGKTAKGIARSLKRSADRSRRRKSDPFRSAMSMLNFYINRAGRKLPRARRARLEAAKDELRVLYRRSRRVPARRRSARLSGKKLRRAAEPRG
jgi:Protein of unknown function (DUF3175)